MIVKDAKIRVVFKNGDTATTTVLGFRTSFFTDKVKYYPVHGRNSFLRKINREKFVEIDDELWPIELVHKVTIVEEIDREIPDEDEDRN